MKKSELKNGAVVQTRDGNIYLKVDNTFIDIKMNGKFMPTDEYMEDLLSKESLSFKTPRYDIVKVNNNVSDDNAKTCNRALRDVINSNIWTWERKKEILDEKEKEYLSTVIKPFRDRIEYISKLEGNKGYFIYIKVKDDCDIILPDFNRISSMYKGMELGKSYTIEKLGL